MPEPLRPPEPRRVVEIARAWTAESLQDLAADWRSEGYDVEFELDRATGRVLLLRVEQMVVAASAVPR
ncbi:MAG: hypothetical protein ACYDCK_01555 [Thermoplasmatota archaeon]